MCGRQYCRDVGGLARVRPASGLGGRLGRLRSDRLPNLPTRVEGRAHVQLSAPASPGLRLGALIVYLQEDAGILFFDKGA